MLHARRVGTDQGRPIWLITADANELERLRPGRVTLGTQGIPLSQGSSVLDPLQAEQKRIRTSPNLIQHRAHGTTLLAARPVSQHFRSPGRARARDRAGPQMVPRQALEQGRELGAR